MEGDEFWKILGVIGTFLGVIAGIFKWWASRITSAVDTLVINQNIQSTNLAIETRRNDSQDEDIIEIKSDVRGLKELAYQVKYMKNG